MLILGVYGNDAITLLSMTFGAAACCIGLGLFFGGMLNYDFTYSYNSKRSALQLIRFSLAVLTVGALNFLLGWIGLIITAIPILAFFAFLAYGLYYIISGKELEESKNK